MPEWRRRKQPLRALTLRCGAPSACMHRRGAPPAACMHCRGAPLHTSHGIHGGCGEHACAMLRNANVPHARERHLFSPTLLRQYALTLTSFPQHTQSKAQCCASEALQLCAINPPVQQPRAPHAHRSWRFACHKTRGFLHFGTPNTHTPPCAPRHHNGSRVFAAAMAQPQKRWC
jgi:hypothetical protein